MTTPHLVHMLVQLAHLALGIPVQYWTVSTPEISCDHITTSAECASAASAVSGVQSTPKDDAMLCCATLDPPGCYFEKSNLFFNSGGKNTGVCRNNDVCICRRPPAAAAYELRSVGVCAYAVQSMSECAAAAVAMGFVNPTPTNDNQRTGVTYDPPGCYLELGQLKWNDGANAGRCTNNDQCICITTAHPTPAPSLAPTYAGACSVPERAVCDAAQGTCFCTDASCAVKRCGCSVGYGCVGAYCTTCAAATQRPTPAPTAPLLYYLRDDGECAASEHLKTARACEAAATALQLRGVYPGRVLDDGWVAGVNFDPPWCYWESNQVKFNALGLNTGACTRADNCICRYIVGTSTPTKRPTAQPTPRGASALPTAFPTAPYRTRSPTRFPTAPRPPTKAPSPAPTVGTPTYAGVCTAAQRATCDARHGTCHFMVPSGLMVQCACASGFRCADGPATCRVCAAEGSLTPTYAPFTAYPSRFPTRFPTRFPVTAGRPTGFPTYQAYTYDVRASVRISGATLEQFASVVQSSVVSVLESRVSATVAGTAFYRPFLINISHFAYASDDAHNGWGGQTGGRRRLAGGLANRPTVRSASARPARRRAAAAAPIDCYFLLWFYDVASADYVANDLEQYLRNNFGPDLDAAVPSLSLGAVVQSEPIVDTTANAAASEGEGSGPGADLIDIIGSSEVDSLHIVLVVLLVLSALVVPLTVALVAAAFIAALLHMRRSHAVEIERVRRESQVEMAVAAHVVGDDRRRGSAWELGSGLPVALPVAAAAEATVERAPIVDAIVFEEEGDARPAASGGGGSSTWDGDTPLPREDSMSLLKAAAQLGDGSAAAREDLR